MMTDHDADINKEFQVIEEPERSKELEVIEEPNENFIKARKEINVHKHIKTGKPVYLRCPHCQELTLTSVKRRPGLKSLLGCLAVGLVAWCGCCLVPCFSRRWQDSIHKCPHCRRIITVVEGKFRL